MADQGDRWRKFKKLNFDSKQLSERAKRAETATISHTREFIVNRWSNIREARRMIVVWVLLVAVLVGSVGLQLALSSRHYRTEAAALGGTYAEAVRGPIDTLNPLYASSSAELSASRLLFSSLYRYDSHGGLTGDLAQSVSLENNNQTYFVTLKKGILWHDGMPLTASDVVFTVNLIKDPAARASLSRTWQGIEVEAVNDTTVKFTLPATIAAFQHALTFPVLPKHILADVPAGSLREHRFGLSPVGSGPFEFRRLQTVSVTSETKILHMNGFEKYHAGAPKLNRFQLHAYATNDAILTALKTGEVNGAADLLSSEAAGVNRERYQVDNLPMYGGIYAIFNTEREVLKDKNVRAALRLAVDTEAIRKKLPYKANRLDLPFLPSQVQADLPSAPASDPARAAEMLEQAGWKLAKNTRIKDGQPLTLEVVTVKGSEYESAVEILAGQWRAIGVKVETVAVDAKTAGQDIAQSKLQPRAYDVLVYELAIGSDPDVYAYWHSSQATSSGLNLSNYANGISDDALVSARARIEHDLRSAKYAAFARQWIEDVPAIGLYQSSLSYVHIKNSETVRPDSQLVTSQSRYADVTNWTVERGSVYKTP